MVVDRAALILGYCAPARCGSTSIFQLPVSPINSQHTFIFYDDSTKYVFWIRVLELCKVLALVTCIRFSQRPQQERCKDLASQRDKFTWRSSACSSAPGPRSQKRLGNPVIQKKVSLYGWTPPTWIGFFQTHPNFFENVTTIGPGICLHITFKITTVHTFIDRCQKRVGGAHLAGPAEMVLMFTVSDQGEYQVSDGEKCAKSSGHCLFLLKRYIFSSAHLAHTLACYLVAHSTQEQVDNLGDLYQVGPCNYTMIPTLHVMACKQHPEYHCHKRLFDVLHAVAT